MSKRDTTTETAAAILEEIKARTAARQAKRETAAIAIESATKEITRLKAERQAALDRQDVAEILDIDTQLRELEVRREIADRQANHQPSESAGLVTDYITRLAAALAEADSVALNVLMNLREQARQAYIALMEERQRANAAYTLLSAMAPAGMVNGIMIPTTSAAGGLNTQGNIYVPAVDGSAPVMWKPKGMA